MTFDMARLRETRRTSVLGHDWTWDLEELFCLIEGVVALRDLEGGRCRIYRQPPYGVFVFREWCPYPNSRVRKVQYFAQGEWHDTVEGALIEPWLTLSSPTDPGSGSSPSTPAKDAGSAPLPIDEPENP